MRKYVAEFIGTFALVLFGTGAVVIAGSGDTPNSALGIGLAFGLTVTVMAYAVGGISGGHFNPAVTLGMVINKRIESKDAIFYIIAQFLGSLVASAVLGVFTNGLGLASDSYGQTDFGSSVGLAIFTEILTTCLFVFVILMVTSKKYGVGNFAPLAIGVTLSLLIVLALNITGASLNPARSFGPAIFAGGSALTHYWVYLVSPLIGAAIAAFLAKYMGSEEA